MKLAKSLLSALIIVILSCTMCVSTFAAYNDVAADNENLKAIEFVDKLGVIPSTWNGDFKPDQYLTRADALMAVYRTLYGSDINKAEYEEAANAIEYIESGETGDVSATAALRYYIAWGIDNYIVASSTENSMFRPSEPVTANELSALLAKILRLVEDENAQFPDGYTDLVSELMGSVEAGEDPVTREQAAVIFTNAITSVEGTPGELGVYTDFDGAPLDSLAVNVFCMDTVDLVIRATTTRNLGYNVKNGTLLSNGADIDLGSDFSDYIGYGISLTYRDSDASGTYTEDEEVLTYSISSTKTVTVPASSLKISSGSSIAVESESGTLNLGSSTYMYLNDNPWPLNDDKYDLIKLVTSIGVDTTIESRDGFLFKCMQATSTDTVYATVFATESKPGKVVGINNGYYTILDYYYAGSDNEYRTYNVLDCKFGTTVKVGDYVSFYESGDKVYINPGNTLTAGVKETKVDKYTGVFSIVFDNDVSGFKHAFYVEGDTPIVANKKGEGEKYNFIMDDTGDNYVITWEAIKTNYKTLEITELTDDAAKSSITVKAVDLATGKEVKAFTVKYDNINAPTALKVGDIVNYSDNGAETPKAYLEKRATITVQVMDMGDHIIDMNTNKVYYKSQYIKDGGVLESGFTYKLTLDMANCVVTAEKL